MPVSRKDGLGSAAQVLKRLREEAGLSVREMAEQGHWPRASSYQHYEDRFKKPHLPAEVVERVIPVLNARGVAADDLLPPGTRVIDSARAGTSISKKDSAAREAFARNLVAARNASPLRKLSRIARRAGIEQGRYLAIEEGDVDPTVAEVVRICKVLQVGSDELFFGPKAARPRILKA